MSRENSLVFSQGSALSGPKSTIVSLVPFAIDEFKPGLIPGQFHIDACVDDVPVCTTIGTSIFYVYIDKERGSLRVPAPSYQVAESIVNDYISGQLAAAPHCHPGIFHLIGEYTLEDVLKKEADKLAYHKSCQLNWYMELVKIADDDWEKTRQHYAISDFQRMAARRLDPNNTRNRPWLIQIPAEPDHDLVPSTLCPACGSDVPSNVVICKYCRFILDETRYNAMSFAGPRPAGVDLSKVPGLRQ